MLNPPSLAAMVVNQAGASAYSSSVRQNGAMELRFLAWAFMEAATHPDVGPGAEAGAGPDLVAGVVEAVAVATWSLATGVGPSVERWALDIYTRGDYDEYWEQPGYNFAHHWEQHSDVPTTVVRRLVRLLHARHAREYMGLPT